MEMFPGTIVLGSPLIWYKDSGSLSALAKFFVDANLEINVVQLATGTQLLCSLLLAHMPTCFISYSTYAYICN